MKKVLFLLLIVLLPGANMAYAQKDNVRKAKSMAGETNPNFGEAEKLINAALTNPETKDQADTWDVAGFVQKRINEKQMENAYLKKPYDTLKAYSSTLKMYEYYLQCDELAEKPDEKGKIKNKFRKANAAVLLTERPNLINGGIQNFNANDNKNAFKFFAAYINAAAHPMFAKEDLLQKDTMMSQVAYFACLSAIKMEDYPSVIKYAPYGEKDKQYGKYVLEFAASAYKAQDKTQEWVETLKKGIQLYPEHSFFFGHLIDYYSNNDKYSEAMVFADEMLKADPQNSFYLYVKGYLYHNMKEYDNAIEFYKKTVEADPNYAEAYSNLGLIYCLKAQDASEKSTSDMNSPQYKEEQQAIKKFYEEAKPYYEKARSLKPEQKDLWLQGLYRIYYNLNMGPEFEAIEKLL